MKFIVESLDDFGRGIIYLNDKITFVSNTLIGEEIVVLEYNEFKKYNLVTSFKFIKKNNDRVDSLCPYYLECGGCQLRHMSSNKQHQYKNMKALNIMKKFAKIEVDIESIVSCNAEYYRNKIVLHIEGSKLGFYKDRSKELVVIDKCLLVDKQINDVILLVKEFIKTNKDLSEVMIRTVNNKIMINFTGNVDASILSKYFDADSIYLNGTCIKGEKALEEVIFDKRFVISPKSFFQVNKAVTNVIIKKIINCIKEVKASHVLDLYCGTGMIGLLVSDYVASVLGVEVVEDAIRDANINKELNNVDNICFQQGKVEEIEFNNDYDTVIVDPPRKGLDKKVISNLLENNYNNIIYMSCDLVTLARDINLLKEVYVIKEINTYDMFPNTYHVECITVLERKQS